MASSTPQESHSAAKRHSRVVSASRTPLARRLTKGPLDVDDPLASDALVPPPATVPIEPAQIPVPTTPFSPERTVAQTVAVPPPPSSKDFSYLLRPEIYHPLSHLNLPLPFRTPTFQPHPSTPIPELLSNHRFRSAATAAALRLCAPPAPPPAELFSLIYIRLACLTLTNHLPFAAEESKALQDVNSPFYNSDITGKKILPWELRVLAIRLQGVGYGDVKRGISGYYDLAKEARAEVKRCSDVDERRFWEERLQDLGLYVADALIESGDMGAAARHLESLRSRDNRDDTSLTSRLALLYINIGDLSAAERCLSYDTSNTAPNASLKPLLSMAEGRYSDAVDEWKSLRPSDIVTQNLAICLFYTGKFGETLELLDGLVEQGRSFHALTFNLATVYELCSERAGERKVELVGRVARGIEERGGCERGVLDFKL